MAALDGGSALRASATAPAGEAGRLGRDVAAELLRLGAATYAAGSADYFSNGDDAS